MLEKLSSGISETTAGPVNKPANKCSLRFLLLNGPLEKIFTQKESATKRTLYFIKGETNLAVRHRSPPAGSEGDLVCPG